MNLNLMFKTTLILISITMTMLLLIISNTYAMGYNTSYNWMNSYMNYHHLSLSDSFVIKTRR